MVLKLRYPTSFSFYSVVTFFILFFFSIDATAQCAGSDNVMLSVCNITDVSSKSVNLFAQLGGTPTPGGTWKDDNKSGGLDKSTGILNAQLINKSGIYHYTYTVASSAGCTDNTAVVTVAIGGNTGVPGPNASICSINMAYNLFQTFDGNFLAPQIGGKWVGNTNNAGLTGNFLDATMLAPENTYQYTYSIPAIGTCAAPPDATVFVTIYRSPEPGIPNDLKLCSNQLNAYTNLDLNSRLTGQDAGGVWTEIDTDEIDNNNDSDSFINIQNIYNTRGAGIYSFTYTVLSDHPTVCSNRFRTVDIILEKQIDFTGATLTVNAPICENEIETTAFSATLKDVVNIPDGSYKVTYTIGSSTPITTTQNFTNNVLTFPIASSNFSGYGDYTIRVRNIESASTLGICGNMVPLLSDVIEIAPMPKINNATLTIDPVCQNEDATVELSGSFSLVDGTYNILYNLSAPNLKTAVPAVMNVVGGIPSFKIPTTLIPNAGKTTILITRITNTATGCSNTSTVSKEFIVNPLPDASNLVTTINNLCQGQPALVKLTGLSNLTSITLTYNISGFFNTVASQTIPLTVDAAGEFKFSIPATEIPNVGLTSFTITNISNAITGCSIVINKKTDFTVNPIPAIPTANDKVFCTSDNATVANLQPQGAQYKWFDSATSAVPLASTTPLVTGNYFVKEVNAQTGCESSLKTISVLINTTPQINNVALAILPICQGFNATVNLSGASNLADGNYDILYNLSGSNTAAAVQATLNVVGGSATFIIASNLIPTAGNTTIAITNITNPLTHCTNTSTLSKVFAVNSIPNVSSMIVAVKDACLGQAVNVDITGLGTLSNITVSYTVTGANAIGSKTISLVVSSGKASFLIPVADLLNIGNNTLSITDLTNTDNSCSAILASPVSESFAVNTVPNSPTASNQEFCETDLKTVSDLAPTGNQYKWYDTAISTTPLAANELLVTGSYYVREINTTSACESIATPINVLINPVPIPVLKSNGEEFCGVDKPTILNLSNNTTASTNLAWYDSLTNGVMLPETDLLSDGMTYYGFDYNTTSRCFSNPLSVTVSLTKCAVTPDGLMIPDGFSPNGDGVNETFKIVDFEFSFPNYTLEIFNRYGNVMFKGDVNKPAWDGKNSSSSFISGDAPTGVYFYIINYNKDNLPPRQGQLYLNR